MPCVLVRGCGAASIVATVCPIVLTIVALVPPMLRGTIDGGAGHRMWLLDAYMFCAIAAPAVGAATLVVTVFAKRSAARDGATPATRATITRTRWLAAMAMGSAVLWIVLLPFVFFATGGSR